MGPAGPADHPTGTGRQCRLAGQGPIATTRSRGFAHREQTSRPKGVRPIWAGGYRDHSVLTLSDCQILVSAISARSRRWGGASMKRFMISAACAVTIAAVPSVASAQVCPVVSGVAVCPPKQNNSAAITQVAGAIGLGVIAYFLLSDSGSDSSGQGGFNFSANDGISKNLSPDFRVNFLGAMDNNIAHSGSEYTRQRLGYNPLYSVELFGARYSFK